MNIMIRLTNGISKYAITNICKSIKRNNNIPHVYFNVLATGSKSSIMPNCFNIIINKTAFQSANTTSDSYTSALTTSEIIRDLIPKLSVGDRTIYLINIYHIDTSAFVTRSIIYSVVEINA